MHVKTSRRETLPGLLRQSLNAPIVRSVLPIVSCAFFLRMLVVLLVYRDLPRSAAFEEFGWEMGWVARSIASGHGFSSPFAPLSGPTALVPPLYPYILAGIFRVFGVYTYASAFVALSLNALFSSLTCIPIWLGVRRSFGAGAAKFAAWIWVFYPFAVYFSGTRVWDYSLTSLLFAICFYMAQGLHQERRWSVWAGFGLLYGLTVLSNPSLLTMLLVLLSLALYRVWRDDERWLPFGLAALLAFLVVVAPWTIRNYRVMHAPVPMRDGFWLEFWAGNAGDTSNSNPAWTHPASNPAEMAQFQSLGEIKYMAEKQRLAVEAVRIHPALFATVSVRRAVRFWTGYWSFSQRYLREEPMDLPNVPFCTVLTFLTLWGLFSLAGERRRAAFPYIALLVLFPLPYYFTHSSMDYRQPIEPEIAVLVTMGCLALQRSFAEQKGEAQLAFD